MNLHKFKHLFPLLWIHLSQHRNCTSPTCTTKDCSSNNQSCMLFLSELSASLEYFRNDANELWMFTIVKVCNYEILCEHLTKILQLQRQFNLGRFAAFNVFELLKYLMISVRNVYNRPSGTDNRLMKHWDILHGCIVISGRVGVLDLPHKHRFLFFFIVGSNNNETSIDSQLLFSSNSTKVEWLFSESLL